MAVCLRAPPLGFQPKIPIYRTSLSLLDLLQTPADTDVTFRKSISGVVAMTERFGIQDHDAQLTQHAAQNPTPQGTFQNISGGDYYVPPDSGSTPSYSSSSTGYVGSSAPAFTGPYIKGFIAPVLLALFFGPFGLFYTTWKGALVLLLLCGLAGVAMGGLNFVNNDVVIFQLSIVARPVSIVWTILARRAYNRREIARHAASLGANQVDAEK
jgi:hypothetical protein